MCFLEKIGELWAFFRQIQPVVQFLVFIGDLGTSHDSNVSTSSSNIRISKSKIFSSFAAAPVQNFGPSAAVCHYNHLRDSGTCCTSESQYVERLARPREELPVQGSKACQLLCRLANVVWRWSERHCRQALRAQVTLCPHFSCQALATREPKSFDATSGS